jgi:hypothetical protein
VTISTDLLLFVVAAIQFVTVILTLLSHWRLGRIDKKADKIDVQTNHMNEVLHAAARVDRDDLSALAHELAEIASGKRKTNDPVDARLD